VDTVGTLGSIVEAGDYSNAQKLTVTGNISYDDVHYVDVNMTSVEVLDLSGAMYDSESIEGVFMSESSNIKEISLPSNITYIGYDWEYNDDTQSWTHFYPFKCSSLISITLPDGMTNIGDDAFYGCSSLTNINLPNGVTRIGNYAFYNCSSLTDITLPDGVTSIGAEAFWRCTSLTNVIIPESVTSIGIWAFENCISLTIINIPKGVTNIGHGLFYDCRSLVNITIPNGVTSIGDYAFQNCRSLANINIPDGVTSIGTDAFRSCSSLTSIVIPKSVTDIGDFVFEDCKSLQKVICNSLAADLGDLSSGNYLYCWLIINRPDGEIPMYGPNWKNVVVNGMAESVTLPYHSTLDFTIPEEVKSIKKISYTMSFNPNYYTSSYGIWRTISLPFKPTSITHAEKGRLAPFDSGVEGAKNFWLRELTTDGFKNVSQIEANHPYIIAMPYSYEYSDIYNISGDVTFSAENLTAEDFANSTPLSAKGTDYTMYASYSYMDAADEIYVLDNYNQFVNSYYTVCPFEAYLKANVTTRSGFAISLNKKRTATRALGDGKRKPQIDDM
jgi:hypothetical protein